MIKRWGIWVSNVIFNVNGQYGSNVNINDYEAVDTKEAIFNIILDSINDGILAVDNEENIIYTNRHFKEMWKIPDEILETKNCYELLFYGIEQIINPEKFLRNLKKFRESNKESLYVVEFKDGRMFHGFTKPLLINNKIEGRIWSFKNIPYLKQSRNQLHNKIVFLHEFINIITNPVFIKDNEGKYIDCNRAWEEFLGKSKNEILGKDAYELFPRKLADKYCEMDRKLLEKKGVQIYEHYLTHADGTIRDVRFNKVTFTDTEGNITGLVGIFSDITKKKKFEKRLYQSGEMYHNLIENTPPPMVSNGEEKVDSHIFINDTSRLNEKEFKLSGAVEYNRLITEFLANISHEFKTPLNIILGTFQLLIMSLQKDSTEKYSRSILNKIRVLEQNCYRLLRLVNNLIDITKIDSGHFRLNLNNVNIIELIENVTLSTLKHIQNKGIKLIFDTNIEEEIISVDPDVIERIMLNLLSNAVKFTNPGGSIKVTVLSQDDILKISVNDTGIGIPEDKKDIIFDRFRQVDRLLTRKHEGSGIGLSLVKLLVEMQGGKISVKSSENGGTEFVLEFPIKVLEESPNKSVNTFKFKSEYVERINIEFSDIYY